ncbi:unnamed protein product [Vitrella brassicaformis CCMP3155]|uniref:J domain-containing protein n=1 Tax=Vitrella brassicaformis (strain CCMP3155) TaxID=1169540 RepID=A0A0G4G1W9_VITBC|nr:unnamed protein product [Vitrella brassicaformis CCMP3155]|eukprot:CEM21732.1 unnamed protein product [Vitrella brassicaformis CCMP3155]
MCGGRASPNGVKKAYHNGALKTHTDKGGGKENFQALNEAYTVIKKDLEQLRDGDPSDPIIKWRRERRERYQQVTPPHTHTHTHSHAFTLTQRKAAAAEREKELKRIGQELEELQHRRLLRRQHIQTMLSETNNSDSATTDAVHPPHPALARQRSGRD